MLRVLDRVLATRLATTEGSTLVGYSKRHALVDNPPVYGRYHFGFLYIINIIESKSRCDVNCVSDYDRCKLTPNLTSSRSRMKKLLFTFLITLESKDKMPLLKSLWESLIIIMLDLLATQLVKRYALQCNYFTSTTPINTVQTITYLLIFTWYLFFSSVLHKSLAHTKTHIGTVAMR